MAHLGNDVVDLRDPANRGKSRDLRFQEKVFHREEREFIHSSADPESALWTLWAAKEAAWKAAVKAAPERAGGGWKGIRIRTGCECLEPGGETLDCRMIPEEVESHDSPWEVVFAGVAGTFAGPAAVRVGRRGSCIHAVCRLGIVDPADRIVWQAGTLPKNRSDVFSPSRYVRSSLIGHLNTLLNLKHGDAVIRRDPGPRGFLPPRLYLCGIPSTMDFSLSHDGRFAAWALLAGC